MFYYENLHNTNLIGLQTLMWIDRASTIFLTFRDTPAGHHNRIERSRRWTLVDSENRWWKIEGWFHRITLQRTTRQWTFYRPGGVHSLSKNQVLVQHDLQKYNHMQSCIISIYIYQKEHHESKRYQEYPLIINIISIIINQFIWINWFTKLEAISIHFSPKIMK